MQNSKSRSNNRKIFIRAAVVWVILSIGCYFLQGCYSNYANFLTALGTETSIIGFLLALWQIAQMRENTENAKNDIADAKNDIADTKRDTEETKKRADDIFNAVQENVKRVSQMIACSDIRSFSFLPHEIADLILSGHCDRAYEKMDSLRKCLIDIKCNPQYNGTKEDIDTYLTELGDAKDILRKSRNKSNGTNPSPKKLDSIYDFLNRVENFLETLAGEIKYSNLSEACHGR